MRGTRSLCDRPPAPAGDRESHRTTLLLRNHDPSSVNERGNSTDANQRACSRNQRRSDAERRRFARQIIRLSPPRERPNQSKSGPLSSCQCLRLFPSTDEAIPATRLGKVTERPRVLCRSRLSSAHRLLAPKNLVHSRECGCTMCETVFSGCVSQGQTIGVGNEEGHTRLRDRGIAPERVRRGARAAGAARSASQSIAPDGCGAAG